MSDHQKSGSNDKAASWESTTAKRTLTLPSTSVDGKAAAAARPVSLERSKMLRRRKAEESLNQVTKLVGCAALVAIISTISYVVIERMSRPTKIDQEYLESIYDDEMGRGSTWSGIKESQPALLSPDFSKVAAQKNSARAEAVVAAAKASTPEEQREAERASLGLANLDPTVVGITNVEAKRVLIEQAVRGFFEADTAAAKLAFVRDPVRVRPLMNDYYGRQPMTKVKWQSLGWTLPVDEPGYRLGYAQALLEDTSPANIIVEEMENGSFLVDWESFVRYGELSWQDFLKMKPSQPKLFRVIASKAESSGYASSSDQEMIELKHPAEEGKIIATLDKTDPSLAPAVQQLQSGKWKDVPLTLRLCYPGATGDGTAVRVAGVEGKGWLILQHKRS